MKKFGKEKRLGFTTAELMVAVGLSVFIAVVAIQNLLRMRVNANEHAAQLSLRAVHEAMQSYRETQTPNTYANQLNLLTTAAPPYLPSNFATGTKNGYSFSVASASADSYVVTATPSSSGITGKNSFYINQKGEVVAGTYTPSSLTSISEEKDVVFDKFGTSLTSSTTTK